MTRLLFVCVGNICRSPTAESVCRTLAKAQGRRDVEVDSAGTHRYHLGEAPDKRSQAIALERGYDLSMLRARAVNFADGDAFDFILGMDEENIRDLKRLLPAHTHHKIHLLLEFSTRWPNEVVPDPYYGGEQGFLEVLARIEDGCQGLLTHLITA